MGRWCVILFLLVGLSTGCNMIGGVDERWQKDIPKFVAGVELHCKTVTRIALNRMGSADMHVLSEYFTSLEDLLTESNFDEARELATTNLSKKHRIYVLGIIDILESSFLSNGDQRITSLVFSACVEGCLEVIQGSLSEGN